MSSHWGFFPITEDRCEDRFVDVTERCRAGEDIKFEADKSGIGKKASLSPAVKGKDACISGVLHDGLRYSAQRAPMLFVYTTR